MTSQQKPGPFSHTVVLYAAAALISLSSLSGCSVWQAEPEQPEPQAELTQAEKVADLRKRLLVTHHKMHMQRAQLQKLLSNKADLELLIRSMQVKQQKVQFNGETAGQTEEVTVDYLQMMTANQAALRNDLATLLAELDALTATAGN
jgi:hypothetical protein